jgi:acid phosphatase type 7
MKCSGKKSLPNITFRHEGIASEEQLLTKIGLLLSAGCLLAACNTASANRPSVTLPPILIEGPYVELIGAGDIASCGSPGDEATATLLDNLTGTIFTAGDNVYNSGTVEEFQNCYAPSWGRHKARTFPSPGNHDYVTSDAAPYYAYFGENAGSEGLGFHSYDLGAWHIVVLNSNIDMSAESRQALWLTADLQSSSAVCTLAYWHHPLFSSGQHGNDPRSYALWQILYNFGVDVVVNGHDHNYERFAPQNPDGEADPRGIREFVAGTGGAYLRPFDVIRPNSEIRDATSWGVLTFKLYADRYAWEFIPVEGTEFRDAGSDTCVNSASSIKASETS